MYSSLRLILVASAVLSWTAGAHAGQPVQRTSHAPGREAAQPSAKTMSHLEAKGGKRSAAHHARPAAHHTHRSKVTHYRRPTVRHHAVHRTGVKPRKTTNRKVTNRKPIRTTTTIRKPVVHKNVTNIVRRYPVRRINRTTYVRPSYTRRYHHRRHSYYPGRYRYRSSMYNRNRRHHHSHRAIVEAVQGNGTNGSVRVRMLRHHSRRFRYGGRSSGSSGLARSGRNQRTYHVNNGTAYQLMTGSRGGRASFGSLRPGEEVFIRTRGNQGNMAQKVDIFGRR